MISKTYEDTYPKVEFGQPINSRSLCQALNKHHHIFLLQCEKLGFELVLNPFHFVRKSGASFESKNFIISERDALIYIMAHDPIYRVKLAKLLQIKELGQIKITEVIR